MRKPIIFLVGGLFSFFIGVAIIYNVESLGASFLALDYSTGMATIFLFFLILINFFLKRVGFHLKSTELLAIYAMMMVACAIPSWGFLAVLIKQGNLHSPIPQDIDLDTILCKRTDRSLRNDFTVAHDKKLYQILDHVNAKKVMVEERMDGRMFMKYKGKRLRFKEIIERPVRPKAAEKPRAPRKSYKPPSDHPWKNFKINPYSYHSRSNKEKIEEPVLTNTGCLLSLPIFTFFTARPSFQDSAALTVLKNQ